MMLCTFQTYMYFIYKKQEVAGNLSSSESPDKKQNSGNLPGGDTQGGLERVPLPQEGVTVSALGGDRLQWPLSEEQHVLRTRGNRANNGPKL